MTNPRRRRGGGDGVGDVNGSIAGGGVANNSHNSSSGGIPRRGRPSSRSRDGQGGEEGRSRRCWFWCRVILMMSLVCGSSLAVFLYPYYEHFFTTEEDFSMEELFDMFDAEENKTASQILRDVVEVSNDFLVFELQLIAFLEGEKLATLLKEKLQPVQNRVTSLTTQTNGYEKMNHVSGGPVSFINSAIQEIDTIEENQLAKLDDQVTEIINEEAMLTIGLADSVMKIHNRASILLEAMYHPALEDEGIVIYPETEMDNGTIEALIAAHPFQDILPILQKLMNFLAAKEEAEESLEVVKKRLGLQSWDDFGVDSSSEIDEETINKNSELLHALEVLDWRKEEIDEYVEEHEEELQLVLPLLRQLMSRVSELQDELVNYATKKRRAYLTLRHTLQEDIRKLRIRINNLRYKYAKFNPS